VTVELVIVGIALPVTSFVIVSPSRITDKQWNGGSLQTKTKASYFRKPHPRHKFLSLAASGEGRQPILAGNWKCNPSSYSDAVGLLKLLRSNFENHDRSCEVVIFPPFPYVLNALEVLEGTGIKVGAQNIGSHVPSTGGAFTGEVCLSMMTSMGVEYVLVGHSERRSYYGETDEDTIPSKVQLSLSSSPSVKVILCVGETLEEYENDLLETVVTMQVKKALGDVSATDMDRIIIAYEPVWAIGTGKVATPQQAQTAHRTIREVLGDMFDTSIAEQTRIQYGGSVTPESISALMEMPDVDGALVGGASLNADSFTRILDGVSALANDIYEPNALELTARECVSCSNTLGESPVWSVKDQTLYWISAPDQECWSWNLKSPAFRRIFDSTLGCVALFNSNGSRSNVILAGERCFVTADMKTNSDFESPTDFCSRPEQFSPTRPNDGRVDRQGRLVFGMYNNYHRGGSSVGENNCGLYRLNEHGQVETLPLPYKYRVSNCISFSPKGDIMYFCDTPTRKVYAFDYPSFHHRRLIWTMPAEWAGGPDGAQVDADGFLWMAISGAGRVVQVDPITGKINTVVYLPVASPTSVTFGGPKLNKLFITTRGPDGGGLYSVKLPFGMHGLPEPEYTVTSNSMYLVDTGIEDLPTNIVSATDDVTGPTAVNGWKMPKKKFLASKSIGDDYLQKL